MLLLIGCGNTAAGMKEDTANAKEKTADSAQNVAEGAKNAGAAMGAATKLTPMVKVALTADSRLSDAKNLIDVDSTAETVTLTGHVTSAALKTLATDITTKTLKDNSATQKIDNKLEIKP
ncbi:MAG: hypothetical protein ACOYON_08755 [Fimbriimonas sp.]